MLNDKGALLSTAFEISTPLKAILGRASFAAVVSVSVV